MRRRIGVAQPAVCVLEGNIAVAVDDGGADARYCSKACRERARWQAKRQKNDVASLDTVPPENLADSVQETQQNWGLKSAPQKTERFPGSAMRPLGRECEARGCTNLIAPTARVDARYCSDACRVEAHRSRNRYKNDSQLPDTDPPGNVRASVQETQQNWGSKSDPQETERFPACIWLEGASGITFVQGSKTGAGFVTLDKNGAHDYGLIPSFSGIMTRAPRVPHASVKRTCMHVGKRTGVSHGSRRRSEGCQPAPPASRRSAVCCGSSDGICTAHAS